MASNLRVAMISNAVEAMDWWREIEVLADAHVTLLADRRKFGPYGLRGGAEGCGRPAFDQGRQRGEPSGQMPPPCLCGEHGATRNVGRRRVGQRLSSDDAAAELSALGVLPNLARSGTEGDSSAGGR
jgi:hypothetical protein